MCDLHEETADKNLADVLEELFLVCGGDEVKLEAFHVTLELGADVLGLGECSCGEEVLPCPVFVVVVWMEDTMSD